MARVNYQYNVLVAKAIFPQAMREIGMKVPKSLGYDPKPVDLFLSKVKCG